MRDGSVNITVLGFVVAAKAAIFGVNSKALPGIFITLFAKFLPASANLQIFLKNYLIFLFVLCYH